MIALKEYQKEFSSLKKKKPILIIASKPEKYNDIVKLTIKLIKTNKLKTVYATLNKPHSSIQGALKDNDLLFFVDGVNKKGVGCTKYCIHGEYAQSLTGLSIAITQVVNQKKIDLVVLDSISNILMYNDSKLTERFVHFLMNKLRELNVSGIIFSTDSEESSNVFNALCQSSDKCIKV